MSGTRPLFGAKSLQVKSLKHVESGRVIKLRATKAPRRRSRLWDYVFVKIDSNDYKAWLDRYQGCWVYLELGEAWRKFNIIDFNEQTKYDWPDLGSFESP